MKSYKITWIEMIPEIFYDNSFNVDAYFKLSDKKNCNIDNYDGGIIIDLGSSENYYELLIHEELEPGPYHPREILQITNKSLYKFILAQLNNDNDTIILPLLKELN